MGRIPTNIADLVGGTPIVRLTRMAPELDIELFAKLEALNPGGSVKDRIGVAMIEAAEREGRIEPGVTTIVEATSGNTGIALAFVCAAKGYELVLTLPQGMSREREGLLRLYGARVEVTESLGGMTEAVQAARSLASREDVFLPDQFSNPANPEIHRRTTGPELWHGRDDHRSGGGAQAAQPALPGRRGRTALLSGAVRRASRAAQDPGHRRRVCPRRAKPRPGWRGDQGARPGRDRDGPGGRRARGRARRNFLRRRGVGGARSGPPAGNAG